MARRTPPVHGGLKFGLRLARLRVLSTNVAEPPGFAVATSAVAIPAHSCGHPLLARTSHAALAAELGKDMSESISRRKLVLGAGASALAATAAGCAESTTSKASARTALTDSSRTEMASDCVPFKEVWPAPPLSETQPKPRCGYSLAARVIFTLASDWVATNPQDVYANAKNYAKGRVNEASFIPSDVAFLPDAATFPNGRRFFLNMWDYEPKPQKQRRRGLYQRALMAARFGSSPSATQGNEEDEWCRICGEAAAMGGEKDNTQEAEAQQAAATQAAQGLTPPEKEEVSEVIDELP